MPKLLLLFPNKQLPCVIFLYLIENSCLGILKIFPIFRMHQYNFLVHFMTKVSILSIPFPQNYYSVVIFPAALQSSFQIQYQKWRKNEGKRRCEVWTPALEPQPSRIPHIPAHAGAGAGVGNRSEQACWAQSIGLSSLLQFSALEEGSFQTFLVGHLPENSLRYWHQKSTHE